MRSRRIAVRRHAGRRRLKRATAALAVVALAVAAYAATQTPLLDVDRVTVEGAVETSADEVLAAARVGHGDPMIGVDAARASDRIERLAWVDRARVVRHWPGTVEIDVTERSPVAVVDVPGTRFALVDADARVLEVSSAPSDGPAPATADGLAELTGLRGDIVEGERLGGSAGDALEVLVAVQDRLPGTVVGVSTDLDATLADGGEIRFGDTEQLDNKIVAAETVLADVDLACLAVLDVRVPGSPALTRHERCP
jgi:cell division protein FtsQ